MLNKKKPSRWTRSPVTRSLHRAMISALFAAVLTACQSDAPPTLTVEQALKMTTSFEGQSFVTPPRKTDDVIADFSGDYFAQNSDTGCKISGLQTANHHRQNRLEQYNSLGFYKKIEETRHSAFDSFLRGEHQNAVFWARKTFEESVKTDLRSTRSNGLFELAFYQTFAGDLIGAEQSSKNAYIEISGPSGALQRDRAIDEFRQTRSDAAIALARGDLKKAESSYLRAIAHLEVHTKEVKYFKEFSRKRIALTQAEYAHSLMLQGRLVEAEGALRDALWKGESTLIDNFILLRFGQVIYEQGRFPEAEKLAELLIKRHNTECMNRGSLTNALSYDLLGKSLLAQGKNRRARTAYKDLAESLVSDTTLLDLKFGGSISWALSLLVTGDSALAIDRLAVALKRTRERVGEKSYAAAEVLGLIGAARGVAGDNKGALRDLQKAMPILLNKIRDSDSETLGATARIWRRKFILDHYLNLLTKIHRGDLPRSESSDPVNQGFIAAQGAVGLSVHRALNQASSRSIVEDPALAAVIRHEQDARQSIAALKVTLANALANPVIAAGESVVGIRKLISELSKKQRALLLEIEAASPRYSALMNPKPAAIPNIQEQLMAGEVLISTYVGNAAMYVWMIPKTGSVRFVSAPLGRKRIATMVDQLRRSLDPKARTLGEIPAFDLKLAHRLYRNLLAPVEAGWKNAKSLLIVAHDALGQLPFSVLVTKPTSLSADAAPLFSNYRSVPWLARDYSVTQLPSVSSLSVLRQLRKVPATRRAFVGFGDPWFSTQQAASAATASRPDQTAAVTSRSLLTVRSLPLHRRAAPKLRGVSSADLAKLPRLPDTAGEVLNIARALNADLKRDVFTGTRASEGKVRAAPLSNYRVVAFATHGLVPGDLNGLNQPALALSSPILTGEKNSDGLLTMSEVLGLKLDADWVVLSACNTASGDGAGAEAVSGLGRAFFYAGTRALLVSNWPVETTSAKALTTDIFKRQATNSALSRSEALRQSMLSLIDKGGMIDGKGNMVFSYAHPIFWAPFSLVGDGGGGKPAG